MIGELEDFIRIGSDVNGSGRVGFSLGPETVNEKVRPDSNLDLFRKRFLGSKTRTGTVYGTGPYPGTGLNRE